MHPDLGGGFGPGFKVEKGYDFVGDNATIPGASSACISEICKCICQVLSRKTLPAAEVSVAFGLCKSSAGCEWTYRC